MNLQMFAKGGYGGDVASSEGRARQIAGSIGNKSRLGKPHSEATKQLMRESRARVLKEHPEIGEEISRRNIGNTYGVGHAVSDKHRKIISETHKGKRHSLGVKHAQEEIERRRITLKAYNENPANQEKIAAGKAKAIATRMSLEGRKRASDAAYARHAKKKAAEALLTPLEKLQQQAARAQAKADKLATHLQQGVPTMAKSDPRPDQHERPHQSPDPGKNPTYPAEGGVGTGTKTDPAKNVPPAQK